MRICGIIIEQRKVMYVAQAVLSALYGDDSNLHSTAI